MREAATDVSRFTDHLHRSCSPIWASAHQHPFVRGIADGTLDDGRFRWFLRQDYLYLREYVRALALAAAHAPTVALAAHFAGRAETVLDTEMAMHRSFAAEWGLTPDDLAAERPAPETQAYADSITASAVTGGFPVVAAALLPCVWSYVELAGVLAAGERPPDDRYARWVDAYAAPEQGEAVDTLRTLVDEVAERADAATRDRMHDAFVASSRRELAFWDMAWRGPGVAGSDPRPGNSGRGSC